MRPLGYLVVVKDGRQVNVQITDDNKDQTAGHLVRVAIRVIEGMKRRREFGKTTAAPIERVLA